MTINTRVWALAVVAGLALWAPARAGAETFTYKVKHNHTVGHCQGVLVVGESDIRYQADNRAHSRIWTYLDIKKVESPSVRKLSIYTHEAQTIQLGREKVFDFEFIEGEVTDELYNFIVNRLARPQSPQAPPTPPGGRWEMATKHVHTFSGCEGTLKVTDTYIEYVTDNVKDARVWKYLDIKRIDSPSSYQLNIYTYEDTTWQFGRDRVFRFELKEPIEPEVYEFIRNKMNQ